MPNALQLHSTYVFSTSSHSLLLSITTTTTTITIIAVIIINDTLFIHTLSLTDIYLYI
jgi:hypothetical protein